MKIYWPVDSLPELSSYTKQEKQKILQDFYLSNVYKKWEIWLLTVWINLITIQFLMGLLYLQNEFHIIPTDNFLISFFIPFVVAVGFGTTITFTLVTSVTRLWLREYTKR